MNISVPPKMAQQINRLSRQRGYASRSELVRDLLREKLEEEAAAFEVFEKLPLAEVRKEFEKTGRYNKQFIESVITGLKQSSVYASRR